MNKIMFEFLLSSDEINFQYWHDRIEYESYTQNWQSLLNRFIICRN